MVQIFALAPGGCKADQVPKDQFRQESPAMWLGGIKKVPSDIREKAVMCSQYFPPSEEDIQHVQLRNLRCPIHRSESYDANPSR
jgi:hypothetical protein